ncbi:MAG: phosphotransferase [Acidimicrobiales bacterium]
MGDTDQVRQAAEAVLGPAELVEDLSFSNRSVVVRLRLADGRLVVAKQPADATARDREEIALRLLPAGAAPRLIAAANTVLVMEDLGSGPSVADLLLGQDPEAARQGLLSWAGALGRIAAATRSGGGEPGAQLLLPDLDQLTKVLARLDAQPPDRLAGELGELARRLEEDRGHTVFLVTDACPDNNRVLAGGVRLFDFETAGWGHAAHDASYLLAPFCTCWCVTRLPPDIQARMIEAYCASYPAAREPWFIDKARAAGVMLVLASLPFIAARIDEADRRRPLRAPATTRQYLYLRLAWLSEQAEVAPVTAAFAGALLASVQARFPAEPVPPYPAFDDSAATEPGR